MATLGRLYLHYDMYTCNTVSHLPTGLPQVIVEALQLLSLSYKLTTLLYMQYGNIKCNALEGEGGWIEYGWSLIRERERGRQRGKKDAEGWEVREVEERGYEEICHSV